MGNQFVKVLTASGMSWGDRFKTAGTVALEGMLVIFAVLAILWGMIELMHKVLYKEPKPKAVPAPAPVATPAEEVAEEENDDGAVVAAIIAAISAMRAESGETSGFRVVSFRKRTMNGRNH